LTALIAQILAPGLFGAELYDLGQSLPLHPEEEKYVASAARKRRRDFAAGRACAHAALAQIGCDQGPILRADDGAPCWPAGLVGSITHTEGYAAALVAHAADFTGLGVDAERLGGVTQNLWPRLFGAAERDELARQADPDRAATLIFSAKEACHKASGERMLRFHDLQVALGDGRFRARRGAQTFEGRFAVEEGLVLTAAWRI
jgi:4'-phosphopantetheinyl transferase EntD